MRIGIFGGTFDPVHLGHLILAEQCREQVRLDEVWFVPAAVPPHKQDSRISAVQSRCEMIEIAIAGNSQFRINRIELERQGPSYTVETLERLQAADGARELFLLVGADSVRELPTWRQPGRILELATIVAVNRGRDRPDEPQIRQHLANGLPGAVPRLEVVQMPAIDISATEIRHRVSAGHSIRYLVPRAVETYIREHSVY